MRREAIALIAAAALGGCVQTGQYADLDFVPPQGDYRLLVLRPDVSVGAVTMGGMVEQRADWTDAGRANLLAALRAQQGGRGANLTIMDRRDSLAAAPAQVVADLERLNFAIDSAIAEHKYGGNSLPTKRRRGLEYTLGEEAVAFGKRTGFDYMLFVHAEDSVASGGRVALQVLGAAGCFIGFCAPSGGGGQLAYASLVDLRSGEVVWFNLLRTGSQLPSVGVSDIRTPLGATLMIERLLGRMKPGRNLTHPART